MILILIFMIGTTLAETCEYYHYGKFIQDIQSNYHSYHNYNNVTCNNSNIKCFHHNNQFYCSAENVIVYNDELYLNCSGNIDWTDRYKNKNFYANDAQKWLHDKLHLNLINTTNTIRYINHNVYFVNDIYHTPNPWHSFEDITNLFIIIEAYNITTELEIIFTEYAHNTKKEIWSPRYDLVSNSLELHLKPYTEIWKIFSPKYGIKKVNEFRINNEYIQIKRAFFNIHGSLSIMGKDFYTLSSCKNSTFINTLIHKILYGLNLQSNKNKTIYMVRRKLTINNSRNIINEQEIIVGLEKRGVMIVDMAELSDYEQIKLAAESTTIIGVHGAALTWSMFMNEGSHIIEIRPKNTLNHCKCFENIAIWRNHRYTKIYNQSDYINLDYLLKYI